MPNKGFKKDAVTAYKYQGSGLTEEEYLIGLERFNNYCSMYHLENYNDYLVLEELVYRETQQSINQNKVKEIRERIEKTEKPKKNTIDEIKSVRALRDEMNENLEQILILKDKLGLFKNKQGEDPFKYIQTLEAKFAIWESKNQASRTRACPWCSKMIMMHMDLTHWDLKRHPFFVDKLLANPVMWRWVREGKITKAELAEALSVSPDYIDEIEKRLFKQS